MGWFLLLLIPGLLLIIAAVIIVAPRAFQDEYRAKHHLCIHCGYDLRESPDRCPECGRDVKEKPVSPWDSEKSA